MMKPLRANNQIEIGQLIEQFGPAILRHATHNPEDKPRISFLPACKMPTFADRFLFGLIANTARIDEHYIGILFVINDFVATSLQKRCNSFGIAHVHLAAVSFDVDPVHTKSGNLIKAAGQVKRLSTRSKLQQSPENGRLVIQLHQPPLSAKVVKWTGKK